MLNVKMHASETGWSVVYFQRQTSSWTKKKEACTQTKLTSWMQFVGPRRGRNSDQILIVFRRPNCIKFEHRPWSLWNNLIRYFWTTSSDKFWTTSSGEIGTFFRATQGLPNITFFNKCAPAGPNFGPLFGTRFPAKWINLFHWNRSTSSIEMSQPCWSKNWASPGHRKRRFRGTVSAPKSTSKNEWTWNIDYAYVRRHEQWEIVPVRSNSQRSHRKASFFFLHDRRWNNVMNACDVPIGVHACTARAMSKLVREKSTVGMHLDLTHSGTKKRAQNEACFLVLSLLFFSSNS